LEYRIFGVQFPDPLKGNFYAADDGVAECFISHETRGCTRFLASKEAARAGILSKGARSFREHRA
jgi:hypothetical protein